MNLVCPECKNAIDTASLGELIADKVIECQMCGITLMVTDPAADNAGLEIIDEGK